MSDRHSTEAFGGGPVGSTSEVVDRPAGAGTAGGTSAGTGEGARRRVQWTRWAQRYGALAALVALFVYNAVDTPFFLTRQSLLFILLRQGAPPAPLAVCAGRVVG